MTNITLNFYDDNNDDFFVGFHFFIEILNIKVIEAHLLHGKEIKIEQKKFSCMSLLNVSQQCDGYNHIKVNGEK